MFERDQQACGSCGRPVSECSDPERVWYPQRTICYATAEAAAANRAYDERFKDHEFHDGSYKPQSEKANPAHPYHFRDGVTIWASSVDLNPDDHFLGRQAATPEEG